MATSKTKEKVKKHSHKLFWDLLKTLPGYKEGDRESFKENFVYQYSNGRTVSLREMYRKYPADYSLMIEAMKKIEPGQKQTRYDEESDHSRKQVLAAICKGLDKRKYKFPSDADKINYAKGIACRAANCAYFNSIPLSRLQAIYNDWCQKNKVDVSGNPELDYIITEN